MKIVKYFIDRNSKDGRCTPTQFMNKSAKSSLGEHKELLFNSVAKLLKLESSLESRQKISQRTTFSLILRTLGLNNKIQIMLQ